MTKTTELYVDGGTSKNGLFGFQNSVICVANKKGKELSFFYIGDKTNNEAELWAVLVAIGMPYKNIHLFCDSQLAVGLVSGKMNTNIGRLQAIIKCIQDTKKSFTISWISREGNLAGHIIEKRLGL